MGCTTEQARAGLRHTRTWITHLYAILCSLSPGGDINDAAAYILTNPTISDKGKGFDCYALSCYALTHTQQLSHAQSKISFAKEEKSTEESDHETKDKETDIEEEEHFAEGFENGNGHSQSITITISPHYLPSRMHSLADEYAHLDVNFETESSLLSKYLSLLATV